MTLSQRLTFPLPLWYPDLWHVLKLKFDLFEQIMLGFTHAGIHLSNAYCEIQHSALTGCFILWVPFFRDMFGPEKNAAFIVGCWF